MEWISVNEGRPPGLNEDDYMATSNDVLMYDKEVGILVGSLTFDYRGMGTPYEFIWNQKLTGCAYRRDNLNITHWMPLPKPPKGK